MVEAHYDTFAETVDYDQTFEQWGYVGPETAAAIMRNFVPVSAAILDAACGSGLTGVALQRLGYHTVDGIDISQSLLELAGSTGAYRSTQKIDMQQLPTSIEPNSYEALQCIGALTYFSSEAILAEFCRLVKPGGYVLISQRDDIMTEQNYQQYFDRLTDHGRWQPVFRTDPMPYLPNHPQYADRIKLQYFVFRVS